MASYTIAHLTTINFFPATDNMVKKWYVAGGRHKIDNSTMPKLHYDMEHIETVSPFICKMIFYKMLSNFDMIDPQIDRFWKHIVYQYILHSSILIMILIKFTLIKVVVVVVVIVVVVVAVVVVVIDRAHGDFYTGKMTLDVDTLHP